MNPLSLLLLFIVTVTHGLGARTWTNQEGQEMEADLVAAEDDSVMFSREGRTYKYPLSNLSDEDQAYVRQWIAENAKPSVVFNELKTRLLRLEGRNLRNFSTDSLKEKQFFAFYYSAGWCGPCRAFTPDLVKAYKNLQAKYPHFELIFISSDRDANAMADYMKSEKMPFPAVKFDQKRKSSLIAKHAQRGIPNLVFMDRAGETISTSYVGSNYVGPRKVLQDIEEFLAQN